MAGGEMGRGSKKLFLVTRLPDEMIAEILSRLPARKIFQFKLVCKSWRSLLSNPKFSLSAVGRERAIVLCSLDTPERLKRLMGFEEWLNFYSLDHEFSVLKLPKPMGEVPTRYAFSKFFGTCNGLILFSADKRMYLWNPSTRCCRELPQLNHLVDRFLPLQNRIASGLCFDESSDDYKVVLVSIAPKFPEILDKTVYVAGLKNGTEWTDISFPYKPVSQIFHPSTSGVLVCGHLHWIVEKEFGDAELIVYFDERTNQFNELPMPEEPNSEGLHVFYFGLSAIHGCLCMSRKFVFQNDNDVFIMREYGVRDSWTKLFAIRGLLVPLNVRDSSELVMVSELLQLYTFNLKSKSRSRKFKFQLSNPPLVPMESFYSLKMKSSKKDMVRAFAQVIESGPLMYTETLAPVDWL